MPLRNLGTTRGNWRYSEFFSAVDTAHDWNRLPSELGLCDSEEDLAVMMAYTDTVSRMNAKVSKEQEAELARLRNKK